MLDLARFPSLYQINTRVWLEARSRQLGRPATLADFPDEELDALAGKGFDYIWLLSVWQTGEAARKVSFENPEWRREFQETLPDLRDEDICGSGFAITDYTVSRALGGDEALESLRERMKAHSLRLMLDFVPNHTAPDHPWVKNHPEFYVPGTEEQLAEQPMNYARIPGAPGSGILAYGRDPYFAGWPDTLQLNYGNPALQEAMTDVLLKLGGMCDGVRCDMAMLVLPEVFQRTWGIEADPFWPEATRRVRHSHPGFIFMAEVYWDLEWSLQQQGFDYTYDKRLYDRLREQHARPVREHLMADLDYQYKMARFLENHDEPRAANVLSWEVHQAAAMITFFTPGLRFFHQGQFEGRLKRISPHLCRAPEEAPDAAISHFYARLVEALKQNALRNGEWALLNCDAAWEGNWTWDCFIAFAWHGLDGDWIIGVVNYAPNQSQCYLRLPIEHLDQAKWQFLDQFTDILYEHDGSYLAERGLYLDIPGWGYHLFEVKRLS